MLITPGRRRGPSSRLALLCSPLALPLLGFAGPGGWAVLTWVTFTPALRPPSHPCPERWGCTERSVLGTATSASDQPGQAARSVGGDPQPQRQGKEMPSHPQQIPKSRAKIQVFPIQSGSHGAWPGLTHQKGPLLRRDFPLGLGTRQRQAARWAGIPSAPVAPSCESGQDALSWQTWPCRGWIFTPPHLCRLPFHGTEPELASIAACHVKTGDTAPLSRGRVLARLRGAPW